MSDTQAPEPLSAKELAHRNLRAMVRGAYDLQKLRIEAGNRLVANFRAKLGIEPGEKVNTEQDREASKALKELQRRYERITDGVAKVTRNRKYDFDGVISDFTELALVQNYVEILHREERQFKNLEAALQPFPIWTNFLREVKGCGPAMGAVIVSEIDITKAKYVSSLWKYAGLDVSQGTGRSRREEHLEMVEYQAADGTTKKRRSITFNPILKTKLMGVLSGSFLRAGNERYAGLYADYKTRLEQNPKHADWARQDGRGPVVITEDDLASYYVEKVGTETVGRFERPVIRIYRDEGQTNLVGTYRQGKTKNHRHNMALRYMVKQFLADLYEAWRPLEGLPIHDPYAEAKLGLTHGRDG